MNDLEEAWADWDMASREYTTAQRALNIAQDRLWRTRGLLVELERMYKEKSFQDSTYVHDSRL